MFVVCVNMISVKSIQYYFDVLLLLLTSMSFDTRKQCCQINLSEGAHGIEKSRCYFNTLDATHF